MIPALWLLYRKHTNRTGYSLPSAFLSSVCLYWPLLLRSCAPILFFFTVLPSPEHPLCHTSPHWLPSHSSSAKDVSLCISFLEVVLILVTNKEEDKENESSDRASTHQRKLLLRPKISHQLVPCIHFQDITSWCANVKVIIIICYLEGRVKKEMVVQILRLLSHPTSVLHKQLYFSTLPGFTPRAHSQCSHVSIHEGLCKMFSNQILWSKSWILLSLWLKCTLLPFRSIQKTFPKVKNLWKTICQEPTCSNHSAIM